MSERDVDHLDEREADGTEMIPLTSHSKERSPCDTPKGGKVVTAFGAVFGAAAAVPT